MLFIHHYISPATDALDIFSKVANILIALFALCFTIYIYFTKDEKDNLENSKNRQTESLKTIILEHNLKFFFLFYDEIQNVLHPISKRKLTDDEKGILNDEMQTSQRKLRLNFTDLLLAVDKDLYDDILKNTDDLIDYFTELIFDGGVNLEHPSIFDKEIISKLSESKTNNVKILYDYNK